jgi:hypothetical protein
MDLLFNNTGSSYSYCLISIIKDSYYFKVQIVYIDSFLSHFNKYGISSLLLYSISYTF